MQVAADTALRRGEVTAGAKLLAPNASPIQLVASLHMDHASVPVTLATQLMEAYPHLADPKTAFGFRHVRRGWLALARARAPTCTHARQARPTHCAQVHQLDFATSGESTAP